MYLHKADRIQSVNLNTLIITCPILHVSADTSGRGQHRGHTCREQRTPRQQTLEVDRSDAVKTHNANNGDMLP